MHLQCWDGTAGGSSRNEITELTAKGLLLCLAEKNPKQAPLWFAARSSSIPEVLQRAGYLEIGTRSDSPGLNWSCEYSGQTQLLINTLDGGIKKCGLWGFFQL